MKEAFVCPQSGKCVEKTPTKPCDVEVYEKKIKLLEKQRKDVSLFLTCCSSSFVIGESLYILFPICSLSSVSLSGLAYRYWR